MAKGYSTSFDLPDSNPTEESIQTAELAFFHKNPDLQQQVRDFIKYQGVKKDADKKMDSKEEVGRDIFDPVAFCRFTESEHSPENILFLTRCVELLNLIKSVDLDSKLDDSKLDDRYFQQIQNKTKSLSDLYFNADSVLQVNLPSKLQKNVINTLDNMQNNKGSITSFEDSLKAVAESITSLLSADTLRRYQGREPYKQAALCNGDPDAVYNKIEAELLSKRYRATTFGDSGITLRAGSFQIWARATYEKVEKTLEDLKRIKNSTQDNVDNVAVTVDMLMLIENEYPDLPINLQGFNKEFLDAKEAAAAALRNGNPDAVFRQIKIQLTKKRDQVSFDIFGSQRGAIDKTLEDLERIKNSTQDNVDNVAVTADMLMLIEKEHPDLPIDQQDFSANIKTRLEAINNAINAVNAGFSEEIFQELQESVAKVSGSKVIQKHVLDTLGLSAEQLGQVNYETLEEIVRAKSLEDSGISLEPFTEEQIDVMIEDAMVADITEKARKEEEVMIKDAMLKEQQSQSTDDAKAQQEGKEEVVDSSPFPPSLYEEVYNYTNEDGIETDEYTNFATNEYDPNRKLLGKIFEPFKQFFKEGMLGSAKYLLGVSEPKADSRPLTGAARAGRVVNAILFSIPLLTFRGIAEVGNRVFGSEPKATEAQLREAREFISTNFEGDEITDALVKNTAQLIEKARNGKHWNLEDNNPIHKTIAEQFQKTEPQTSYVHGPQLEVANQKPKEEVTPEEGMVSAQSSEPVERETIKKEESAIEELNKAGFDFLKDLTQGRDTKQVPRNSLKTEKVSRGRSWVERTSNQDGPSRDGGGMSIG